MPERIERIAPDLIDDISGLEACAAEWDALAVEAGRPYCAPAWMLAWWRNARPPGALLRAVAVRRGGRLVGIAPFWTEHSGIYRLLSSGLAAPVEPLAERGLEREVAATIWAALREARPSLSALKLESQSSRSCGLALLDGPWAEGRSPWIHTLPPVPAPNVDLRGHDYDSWIRSKSRHFRKGNGRLRRKLERAGCEFRLAGPSELARTLDAFCRLHHGRWDRRGGSDALRPGVREMLGEVGRELMEEGRFRLFLIEVGDRIISVHVFVSAGAEVTYWNGGFDEAWGAYSPSLLTVIHAISDALQRRDERLDLGPGAQDYKYRLASGEEYLQSVTLVPRDFAYVMNRLRLAPYQARWAVSRRLSGRTKDRLRRIVRR
jgi:CelD/BcsL family acetyltransferase involved in cellulose biosynthesis